MSDNHRTRRTFLRGAAGATVATTLLAGCSSSSDAGTTNPSGDGSTSASNEEDAPAFDGWMDDVSNYDGVVDETGSDEVTVDVGADGNEGSFAFGPAALKVSAGTTVVWQWTGKGSSHNVVADDGSFESKLTAAEGFTFEHTFEDSGTVKYFCEPHEAMGMKGVVVVE